ncbi:MAG: hypothetical protein H6728_11085 [Myxococcales bacterium]|nr:hypothetical protein [Myxococcales bacterium]MCB9643605.1 hypothetical protein [Myxococcales bacterium]
MTARDPKNKQEQRASTEQIEEELLRLFGEDEALYAPLTPEEEALLEALSGEPHEEPLSDAFDATTGLLRHSLVPPELSAVSFARIGSSIFGEDFQQELAVNPQTSVLREPSVEQRVPEDSLWSRFLAWLWPTAGWRPAWGVAALGGVFLVMVGAGVFRVEPPTRTAAPQGLAYRAGQGPWKRGEDPFTVTRNASERLGHVLRFYREQRHDQWLDDLGSSYAR